MEDKITCKSQEYAFIKQVEPKWLVTIPSGGHFTVCYEKLTLWQRMWMNFIGWGVKENK